MEAPRIAEVQKRLFLPDGGHVVVPNAPATPRIEVIPNRHWLLQGPHLPLAPPAGRRRLIAFCCTCQQTITDLPAHVAQFKEHRDAIRYMLLPDLRDAA